jgi:hypothetical protein
MSYEKVREAALARAAGDSSGAWRLADALVAEIPERQHGKAVTAANGRDVTTVIADIVADLDRTGVETPAGGGYTVAGLRELRLVALGWPRLQRQPEAAFRTHQEVGTTDERARAILRALCQAARSQRYSWPGKKLGIDRDTWNLAINGVIRKVGAGNRYPVSANDVRIALERKTNVPPKGNGAIPVTRETAIAAVEAMDEDTKIAVVQAIVSSAPSTSEVAISTHEALNDRADADRMDYELQVIAQGGRIPSQGEVNAGVGEHPLDGVLERSETIQDAEKLFRAGRRRIQEGVDKLADLPSPPTEDEARYLARLAGEVITDVTATLQVLLAVRP